MDPSFLSHLKLSNYEKKHSAILALSILCYLMGISPENSRTIISRCKDVKLSVSESTPIRHTPMNNNRSHSSFTGAQEPENKHDSVPQPSNSSDEEYKNSNNPVTSENFLEVDRHMNQKENNHSESLSLKKSTAVTSYFNNRRFNGDLSQSIEITLRDFDQCSLQYRLTSQQRADFFINTLADEARTFFLTNVQYGMSFHDIKSFMLKEYNSNSR